MSLAAQVDFDGDLDDLILDSREALKRRQRDDGHWIFEFEADATIPAEYIMLQHFLGAVDGEFATEVQPKIANYLRDRQAEHGGGPDDHG